MFAQAAKEVFALFNLCCGAVLFLVLAAYVLGYKQRRSAVVLTLLAVIFLCALNSFVLFFIA